MSFTFDTLEYAKTLREGQGAVPPDQAEKMALALKNALGGSGPHGVATRLDIENLRIVLKADIDTVQRELVFHRWAFGIIIGLLIAILAKLLTL